MPLFFALLLSLMTAFLPVSALAHKQDNHDLPEYRVAMRTDDVGTKIVFEELERHFNLKFHYVYYEQFSDILADIQNNKVDFTANVTYSKERAQNFDISHPTNIEYTYLYTRPEFGDTHTLKDVKTVAIADELIFKSYIQDLYPQTQVVSFSSYEEAEQLITSGKVDGVIDSISKLGLFLKAGFDAKILNDKLPIQPVGIATAKGRHTELVTKRVAYLHTPEMQKQLRLRMDLYQYNLRKAALRKRAAALGIDASTPLKVKFENVIQLSEYNQQGALTGIGPDILNHICDILGLTCIVTSPANEPWDQMYSDLLNKKIDVLAPITISNKRKQYMYFSHAYFLPEAIVVKRTGYKDGVYKSVSEMVVEKISVIKGDYYDQLLTNMLPGKALYRMESRDEQMKALREGKVDYVVLNKQNYNKMLMDDVADFSTEEDQDIGVFHHSQIGFAFPKTDEGQKLSVLFSAAQSLIDVPAIVKQYDAHPDWRGIIKREKNVNCLVWAVLVTSILFMSFVIWFVYRQAITDNLTKLRNRRGLYQKFSRGIPKDRTLVYIDVNRFKVINDTHGHSSGDLVLQRLAYLISRYWPGQSFRIGGDEFVLIAKIKEQKLEEVLDQLQSFTVEIDEEQSIEVHTSCGISNDRKFLMTIDQVLHLADKKMYHAKARAAVQRTLRANV